MKKFITRVLILLIVTLSYGMEITCPYSNVDEKAKGTYVFKSNRIIYYVLNEKVYSIETQRRALLDYDYSYIPFYDKKYYPSLSYEDFIQFDRYGNAYILYNWDNSTKGLLRSFILKYNPVKNESSIYEVNGINPISLSFTVSDNGEWIFVHYYNRSKNWKGYATVAAIPVNNPNKTEVLFEGELTELGFRAIKNLCFDSNTKNLYFCCGYKSSPICHVMNPGLYILKPENGKYLKKNLKKLTSVKYHEINDIIFLNKKDGIIDYGPVLELIKNAGDPKYSHDEIEFSLKYFKDSYNNPILYKEDENGNPLTDEAALKYLYENPDVSGNFYWFMCNYCNSNDFEYEITEKIIPLEHLLLVKETGESAYTADYDFFHSLYGVEDGFLFSNNEGLWGMYMNNWKNATIYHITDNKGNFIKRQNKDLKEIRLKGLFDHNQNEILIQPDYFLFLASDRKKAYCVKNDTVYDLSTFFPRVEAFNYSHLEGFRENNLISLLNENKPESNPKSQSKPLLLILVAIILLLSTIIFILAYRNLVYRKNKPSIKNLKKNKKFIFDIQEKERGRVSRDIHDSVIQDIRSIRLNSEMLKVEKESEERKQQIIKMATDCVVTLRNICYNLTPAELATHADGDNSKIELVSIIQTLVTQFIERTHVPCSIQIDESFTYPTFEKEVSQNLFRIIQETLTNIEKHSYATQCSIYIRSKDDGKFMVIYISDDGIGCDIQSIKRKAKKTHFGLVNIQERARLIGAQIEFESTPGEGMETRIILPIKEA